MVVWDSVGVYRIVILASLRVEESSVQVLAIYPPDLVARGPRSQP